MSDPNPYASPAAREPHERRQEARRYRSRMHAVRGEFWRGMKFGGRLMGEIVTILWVLLWLSLAVARLFNGRPFSQVVSPSKLLEVIAQTLVVIIVPTVLGAIAGGLIMGVAAAITYR